MEQGLEGGVPSGARGETASVVELSCGREVPVKDRGLVWHGRV